MRTWVWVVLWAAACDSSGGRGTTATTGATGATNGTNGTTNGTTGTTNGTTGTTNGTNGGGDGGTSTNVCVTDPKACYTVYAHGDHTLYKIDLQAKTLDTIGPFNAPKVKVGTAMEEDTITDLAVAPDNTIYVISKTNLYTADPNNGQVSLVGPVTACGDFAVALTFTDDGSLYAGDHKGAFCKIDLTTTPLGINKKTLSGGYALSGDLVAVGDGTMYGTATLASDATSTDNNILIKIDPSTATVTPVGKTGSKNLFGLSYALGQVFGFTHDCSGSVVVIDPATGKGTPYNIFPDPMPNCMETGNHGTGLSFAGAGVNSMVTAQPVM